MSGSGCRHRHSAAVNSSKSDASAIAKLLARDLGLARRRLTSDVLAAPLPAHRRGWRPTVLTGSSRRSTSATDSGVGRLPPPLSRLHRRRRHPGLQRDDLRRQRALVRRRPRLHDDDDRRRTTRSDLAGRQPLRLPGRHAIPPRFTCRPIGVLTPGVDGAEESLGGNCQPNVDLGRALGARGVRPLMLAAGRGIVTGRGASTDRARLGGSLPAANRIGPVTPKKRGRPRRMVVLNILAGSDLRWPKMGTPARQTRHPAALTSLPCSRLV